MAGPVEIDILATAQRRRAKCLEIARALLPNGLPWDVYTRVARWIETGEWA